MRWLMWFSLGFACGCGVGGYLFRETELLVLAAACLGLLLPAWLLGKRYRPARAAALLLAGIAAGCGVFWNYDEHYVKRARAMDATVQELVLTASDYSWMTDYGGAVDGTIRIEGKEYKVRLYLNDRYSLTPGDQIRTQARFRFTDEGGISEPTFHRTNGILLLAYQLESARIIPGTPGPEHFPAELRMRLKELIHGCFSPDTSGFARALLLGDRTGLSYENELAFRLTGVSHVVAISGLHVSILFGLVLMLTGKQRHLTAILGIPVVLVFAAVAGFTPSITRAALMQILMMLALLFRQEYDPPTALAIAMTAMLAVNPLTIASAGFQMSVGSVAGIHLFYGQLRKYLGARFGQWGKGKGILPGLVRGLASSVSLSLSASLFTMPLVAFYYGTVSLVNVAANLIIMPLISGVFYGIMLSCGAYLAFPLLGRWLGFCFSGIIRWMLGAVDWMSALPLSAVYTKNLYVVLWLALCYALIAGVVIRRPERLWPVICCGAAGLVLALGLSFASARMDDYRVTVLDVGQGQCVMLQSRDRVVLVDCGGDYDEDAGDLAAETLLSMGVSRIDGLILTHYDRDHAGGVPYLAQRIGIDSIYLPRTADADGLLTAVLDATGESRHIWLDRDTEIPLGSCSIRIFAPDFEKSGNESCASVLFQNEKYDTLITGDSSAAGESALLRRGVLPDLEVLIVGHHGSAGSTSAELVYRTAPDLAIISVGADNSYGHPAEEILNRLTLYGCAVYRTDLMGNIIFRG